MTLAVFAHDLDVEVIGLNLCVVVSRGVDVLHEESHIPFADNDNGVSQVEVEKSHGGRLKWFTRVYA